MQPAFDMMLSYKCIDLESHIFGSMFNAEMKNVLLWACYSSTLMMMVAFRLWRDSCLRVVDGADT